MIKTEKDTNITDFDWSDGKILFCNYSKEDQLIHLRIKNHELNSVDFIFNDAKMLAQLDLEDIIHTKYQIIKGRHFLTLFDDTRYIIRFSYLNSEITLN